MGCGPAFIIRSLSKNSRVFARKAEIQVVINRDAKIADNLVKQTVAQFS
mgnify:CR=1 FL=1